MYELVILTICLFWSRSPSPSASVPQLFDTTLSRFVPASNRASISDHGTPHSPKPPTATVDPETMSATAAAASATTFVIPSPPSALSPRWQTQ